MKLGTGLQLIKLLAQATRAPITISYTNDSMGYGIHIPVLDGMELKNVLELVDAWHLHAAVDEDGLSIFGGGGWEK